MNRFDDIRKWGMDRNIIQGTRPEKQFVKLIEEVGELAEGLAKGKPALIMDGIGDAVVVLVMLSAQCGLTIEECIEEAWNTIKDRKGRIVDGIFVKEADLPKEG